MWLKLPQRKSLAGQQIVFDVHVIKNFAETQNIFFSLDTILLKHGTQESYYCMNKMVNHHFLYSKKSVQTIKGKQDSAHRRTYNTMAKKRTNKIKQWSTKHYTEN